MFPGPLLIANRGEVAVRIARSAADLGCRATAIYCDGDGDSLHVERADASVLIEGGARAYLDRDAIVSAAVAHGCHAVHPGYGFLAEDGEFAAACETAGLVFVGPTPAQLALLGDKPAARNLAAECGVPTLEASAGLDDVTAFARWRAGFGKDTEVVLKAVAGGGGRGMRVVGADEDCERVFEACAAEALAAFGNGALYAERYLADARHIEVQVVGDGTGAVAHLWERDCSLQRRHQKIIEIAPAPALDDELRQSLIDAALAMARALDYRGLGTFEFLVERASGAYFFIEANARLQVEHTVTEEILGLDLVAMQLRVAAGETIARLGLADGPPVPRGIAIQARINAETLDEHGAVHPASGAIARFDPAGGPGVRVDTAAYTGFTVNPAFDSMIAKVIVHTPTGDFGRAMQRTARALNEFTITGIETNLPLLNAITRDEAVGRAAFDTRFVERHAAALLAAAQAYVRTGIVEPPVRAARSGAAVPPAGSIVVEAPMRASVVSIDCAPGDSVRHGQQLAVLEAMKMHHVVTAARGGTVTGVVARELDVVDGGDALLFLAPDEASGEATEVVEAHDLDARRADLEEVFERHRLGLDAHRPDAVARRRRISSRTARENIGDLCDPGSFIEYGALAIAAQRRRRSIEDLAANTPADGMVAGFGTVNAAHFGEDAARCAVLAYDYTVLAGTQGHNNHKKKDRLFELAEQWRAPVVFFTEGGGGRPGDVDTDDLIMSWLDIKTFATWPKLSGIAPRIAVNSGRCFAGNAVIFGCADITIATRNSNIGLAGPAMIAGGGLGTYTPEDIGPIEVQATNGVVDIVCEDEAEATAVARRTLGCFQGPIDDWTACDQRVLRHVVPENRLRVYDMRALVHALADEGSVIEFRRNYGVGLITALVRIEGCPFGLIANDPRHLGGAIDGDGGEKGGRFLQLCDAYGVPVVSLCDTPGFMVGPDSEKTGAVRRGSRLILASANLSVPLFTIIVRKGYGLGAQAMAGGSFHQPFFTIAWPTAELGPMGLEGAVELGFSKELAAAADDGARAALYTELLARMYEKGKAVSVASSFEIDAVIDPAETRAWLLRGRRAAGPVRGGPRRYIDVW